jgi:hypothetical protein
MNAALRSEIAALLREDIALHILKPAPGEAEVLECLCELASHVPQPRGEPITPELGEDLENLAVSLDRGMSLIGASRLKGTAVERYFLQATQIAVLTALAFETPVGRA